MSGPRQKHGYVNKNGDVPASYKDKPKASERPAWMQDPKLLPKEPPDGLRRIREPRGH